MEYRLSKREFGNITAEDLYNYSIKPHGNVFAQFISWCESQESNRFFWLVVSFFVQVGLTLPLTAIFIVFLAGNNLLLWMIIISVNIPVLILNLAAMPTKTTLPFVFFGWLTQIAVILYCIAFALLH